MAKARVEMIDSNLVVARSARKSGIAHQTGRQQIQAVVTRAEIDDDIGHHGSGLI